jgi:hypothetical protein
MRETSSRARVVLPDRSTLFMRDGILDIVDGYSVDTAENEKVK